MFAFLSAYEGFGLTPLEAMRHGLPTVVLDTPVAREVYGDGAWYVPAGDADAVAAALVTLLRDPVRRASQIAAGDRRRRPIPLAGCGTRPRGTRSSPPGARRS